MLHQVSVLLIMVAVSLSITACGGIKTEGQAISHVHDYLRGKDSRSSEYRGRNCLQIISEWNRGSWGPSRKMEGGM